MITSRPRLAPALLLLWGATCVMACAEDPEQARRAEIRRAWERSPEEAIALVNQLDELEQLAIIEQVFEPHGGMGASGIPCERLDRPNVEARCKRFMSRAHLQFYRQRDGGDDEAERTCLRQAGAAHGEQDTPFGLAVAAASQGSGSALERGLTACRCLQTEYLRDECTFALAETLAQRSDIRAEAIDACVQLRPRVAPMCVEHTLGLANVHLELGSTSGPSWRAASQFADRLQRAPQDVAHDDLDGLLGFFWSYVMFMSVDATFGLPDERRVIPPDLTERLPGEALPHLRSAVAWAVLASTPQDTRDTVAATERVRAILAGTAPLPGASAEQRPGLPRGCGRSPGPDGSDTTRLHFLTRLAESRQGSDDPERDLVLAVAAAQDCLGSAHGPTNPTPRGSPPAPR